MSTLVFKRSAELAAAHVGTMLLKYGLAEIQPLPAEQADRRQVRYCISTADVDRDNDVIDQRGWDLSAYLRNPVVLWAHSHTMLPVGKCVAIGVENGRLMATVEFDEHPFADTVYRMVKRGYLKATSVGFRSLEAYANDERQGIDFKRQELLEFSIVPVPANPHALEAASADGIDLAPLKAWVEQVQKGWPGGWSAPAIERTVAVGDLSHSTNVGAEGLRALEAAIDRVAEKATALDARLAASARGVMRKGIDEAVPEIAADGEPVRWNRSLSKAFDVSAQEFPAQSLEQELASKYLESPIRNLHHGEVRVRSARMGSFLSALDEFVGHESVFLDAVRNIDRYGKEAPPRYEDIQLNSKTRKNFLVDGMRFLQWNGTKICLRVEPRWYGLEVTHYSVREHAHAGAAALEKVQARAKDLNFLKGEAFTLGGEFLARGVETLDDLLLDEKNQQAVKRLLTLINDKGAEMECRGALLVGPPGTGKTLSGRILMNSAQATFIWVSSRDFAYSGGFQGMSDLFEMARENAPCVAFVEDVDNWLDGYTTDMMKTEMDGIAQYKGVLTILTTNYPEHLPKALIDRPGRFHDVLRFDLPNEAQRKAMLEKWLPGLPAAEVVAAVGATAGMSGAHLRELARFAGILADQDGLGKSAALAKALEKLQEQRDLITSVQAQGSRYRAPAHVTEKGARVETKPKVEPNADGTCPDGYEMGDDGMCHMPHRAAAPEKRGRVLSRKNEAQLRKAVEHMVACAEQAGYCRTALDDVLAAVMPMPSGADEPDEPDDEAEEDGSKTIALDLADDLPALTLTLADDPEFELAADSDAVDIPTELIGAAVAAAMRSGYEATARAMTERALNQMRGRLD